MKRIAIAIMCLVVLIPTSAVAAENVTITVGPSGGEGLKSSSRPSVSRGSAFVEAWPQVFYPWVREGFRDYTAIDVFGTESDELTVEITRLSQDGGEVVVRTELLSWLEFPWLWDGKNDGGTVQPEGRYGIYILSDTDAELARTTVQIDRATTWKRVSQWKSGSRYVDKEAVGCSVKRKSRIAVLNCWQGGRGGRFATAYYRHTRPHTDYQLTGRIRATFALRVWRLPGKIKTGWSGRRIWLGVTHKKYVRIKRVTWFFEARI